MGRALAIASIVWPVMMAASVWQRVDGSPGILTAAVYAAGSAICHQKPERSFHSGGVSWPVCARCSGLYLSAPIGALAALVMRRRRQATRHAMWLVIASVPTFVTLGLELAGLAAPSNLTRAIAALPAGAMIAFVLVQLASERRTIE